MIFTFISRLGCLLQDSGKAKPQSGKQKLTIDDVSEFHHFSWLYPHIRASFVKVRADKS